MNRWRRLGSSMTWASLVAVVASLVLVSLQLFDPVLSRVVIASSPSGATIQIGRKALGKSPVTAELKHGIYVIRAMKHGYEPMEQAIYVGDRNSVVNLDLRPSSEATPPVATPVSRAPEDRIAAVTAELGRIKSMILVDPEDAATVPMLRGQIRLQREQLAAIRAEVKDIRGQSMWYVGTLVTVTIGLLGVVVTLIAAQLRDKTDGDRRSDA